MKKNLLITGGSGFLGVHLALELKKKFNVFLGSRNQKRNREASNLTKCKDIPLDVSNISSVRDAVNYCNPSIIIHAAATKFVDISEEFPFECSDVNILGSSNVARVAIERGVNTVIGISTDKASQPIKNFYGFSKATMEKLFLSANNNSITNFLCVRYGNVAWSTGSVLPIWKEMHKKNKIILTTGPEMRRFFFTINDAVDLVTFSINNSKKFSGKIVCADMKSAQMLDVIKIWIKNYGGTYKIIESRKGDRLDEYLIGMNEIKNTYKIKNSNKVYYIIDFDKKIKNPINKIISSKNSKNLNNKELIDLLKIGLI
ncbi:polysaccharide biosynthesis protein [Candidatus Pelagibacter ubique]|mgnify:FL=1|jgi:UDP-N-acetylglucosamine 4,6-dehydratase/5-epimerase|nr:polysaccharide biosynthesis protein [Candidatus Pelagibacter ubique]